MILNNCATKNISMTMVTFFVVVVGQLHEDAPTEGHPGNLTILLP